MDTHDTSSVRSPRRELQGPRPAPLKVRKDSHKIRKPPVAPPTAAMAAAPFHHPAHAHAPPPRPPVIIYTVSPKIIHANPNEFMSLVQRLTGPNSTSAASPSGAASSSSAAAFQEINSGAVSPAARFASVERTRSPDGRRAPVFFGGHSSVDHDMVDDYGMTNIQHGLSSDHVQRTGNFPGILSPNPNSLPPIPPNFFSPPSSDSNYNINNTNYFEHNNFMLPSPYSSSNNFIISPQINMPSPNTLALFNTFFDL